MQTRLCCKTWGNKEMNPAVIIIITAVLAAAVVYAVLTVVKRFRKGSSCCGDKVPRVSRTRKRFRKSEYPYSFKMKITGMVCDNCCARVENALNELDGICARVSIGTHTAVIHSRENADKTIRERAEKAVVRAGYGVERSQE